MPVHRVLLLLLACLAGSLRGAEAACCRPHRGNNFCRGGPPVCKFNACMQNLCDKALRCESGMKCIAYKGQGRGICKPLRASVRGLYRHEVKPGRSSAFCQGGGSRSPRSPTPAPRSPTGSGGGGGGGGSTVGGNNHGLMTHFDGCYGPYCACGIPPGELKDDHGRPVPYCALNEKTELGGEGEYSNGDNCGRWVKIKMGRNCEGAGNQNDKFCVRSQSRWGWSELTPDQHTGKVIYCYVADRCGDDNYWCENDRKHLDVSKQYLKSLGLDNAINGREINWSYMDGPPSEWSMRDLRFVLKFGSKWMPNGKGFWGAVAVTNTANGIQVVQQWNGGSWQNCEQLNHLGSMWVLNQPYNYRNYGVNRVVKVRVLDKKGAIYGNRDYPIDIGRICGNSACANDEPVSY